MLKPHRHCILKANGLWLAMEIGILARLVFLSAITIVLWTRKEKQQVPYFPQQTWPTKEMLPVYWSFALISLISFVLYRANPHGGFYLVTSPVLTLLAGAVLFVATKLIIFKRRLSLNVIGFKKRDVYWFLILVAIQFSILIFLFFTGKITEQCNGVLWPIVYFSIILVFGPVIEEVFYLGMMFIPTSRIVGLKTGAVLVCLLQALVHFDHNAAELATNFGIFGLLGCYLYIKTKGILVPLLVHSSINFFVLLRDLNSFSA